MKLIETILKKSLLFLHSYIIISNILFRLPPYLHDITIGKQREFWYRGPLDRLQKAWVRTDTTYNIEIEFFVAMKIVRLIKNSSELSSKCNIGAYHCWSLYEYQLKNRCWGYPRRWWNILFLEIEAVQGLNFLWWKLY